MSLLTNGFEGQTNGASATGTNSASSGVALAFGRSGTSTTTYSNAHVAHGSMGLLLASSASATCSASLNLSAATSAAASRRYLYTDALPTATTQIMQINGVIAYLRSDGKIEVHDKAGLSVFTSTGVLATATQYRLEMALATGTGTTDGTIKFAAYTGDSLTAITGTTYTTTTSNAGTGTFTQAIYGRSSAGTANAWNDWIDDLAAQDGTTTFLGPASSNTPPVASAGPNQTGIEPYDMVTLDGTGSSDIDGTIASYAWTQTAGTTVTLAGNATAHPTFTAPATINGDNLIFSLVVTDNGGASSSPSTVTITVLSHTIWRLDAGAPTPVQLIKL